MLVLEPPDRTAEGVEVCGVVMVTASALSWPLPLLASLLRRWAGTQPQSSALKTLLSWQ